jgi:hypothetical protein
MKFESYPLRDDTKGLLRAWPGGGTRFPTGVYVPTFRAAYPGEELRAVVTVPTDLPERVHCKYCYGDRRPLVLQETVCGETSEMIICSECAYGLSPSASSAIESLRQAPWLEVS